MLKKIKAIEKRVSVNREEAIKDLIAFSMYDSLFFVSDNIEFATYQNKEFSSVIKSLESLLSVTLKPSNKITVSGQDVSLINKEKLFFERCNNSELVVCVYLSSLLKSNLLSIAFVEGLADSKKVFELGFIEEIWQQKKWGVTDEIKDRNDIINKEILFLEKYLNG